MHDFTVEFNDDGAASLVGTLYDADGLNPQHVDFTMSESDAHAFDTIFSAFVARETVREVLQGVVDEGFAANWPKPEGCEDLTYEQLSEFVNTLVDGGLLDEVIADYACSVA